MARASWSAGVVAAVRLRHAGLRRAGRALLATVVAAAAAGCGTSNEPTDWVAADASGAVEVNFMESCQLANAEIAAGDSSPEDFKDLCQCSYTGLRADLDFDEFKELDTTLRVTPDPNTISKSITQASWDKAEQAIRNCIRRTSLATPSGGAAEPSGEPAGSPGDASEPPGGAPGQTQEEQVQEEQP